MAANLGGLPGLGCAATLSKTLSHKAPPTSSVVAQTKRIKPKMIPALAGALSFFTPSAYALPKDQILTTLTKVESAVEGAQEAAVGAVDALGRVVEATKPSVVAAAPLVQKAADQAGRILGPAGSALSKQAEDALRALGFDPQPAVTTAKSLVNTAGEAVKQASKAIEWAKPIASTAIDTVSSSDPSVILVAAGGAFLAYLLLPPTWSAISYSLRGYKGELTPAQTLDSISNGNYLLIDIRPEKEKSKAGVPRLPSSAKNKLISIPSEDLPSKIRGLVRNVKKLEAEIVALKISYLKRVNQGSNIVIMDSYADVGKIVARALTGLGFKNCWVMVDGFSGSKGWLQGRLGTESYNVTFAEVLSASRVIPAAVRRFGTTSGSSRTPSQKRLPGGVDD
ncbi:calcium sensing receptor, chloroplastic [Amborella trichopoda]|uniref:Rhodanese domain-containing protein n=1 Tax=Amborella trichopoda TaxID=13333 RepID=U5DH00_AMBTC|nr:calcium sensing receptor, chloroplastic [Amborella trichopoda]ERN19713.1 hypothetical protein AMTR_s00062p00201460 [Amborella trichopoda]|eukprot:XP_006858246.1 calcium sensing receptor, chloroplastic [Amborella trichopoda]